MANFFFWVPDFPSYTSGPTFPSAAPAHASLEPLISDDLSLIGRRCTQCYLQYYYLVVLLLNYYYYYY